jgi:hypothetical protein
LKNLIKGPKASLVPVVTSLLQSNFGYILGAERVWCKCLFRKGISARFEFGMTGIQDYLPKIVSGRYTRESGHQGVGLSEAVALSFFREANAHSSPSQVLLQSVGGGLHQS